MSQDVILQIRNLKVYTPNGKLLIDSIDMDIHEGEVAVLFGPNGAGKSSLLSAIMGIGGYRVEGTIRFYGQDITGLSPDHRAKLGIGLAYQKPPSFKGLKVGELLKILAEMYQFPERELDELVETLDMKDMLDRDVNRGFSGGESKRLEILTLAIQRPKLALIDEPDSGVDLEAISKIASALRRVFQKHLKLKERKTGGIVITHTGLILEHLHADTGYILINRKVTCSANPMEIFETIRKYGYSKCVTCCS